MYVCVCMFVCMCVCVRARVYVCACVYVCTLYYCIVHLCVYVCVRACMCVCVCLEQLTVTITYYCGNLHRVVDNMPVTWCYTVANSQQPFCTTRFPVGCYVTHSGKPHDACFLSVSHHHGDW